MVSFVTLAGTIQVSAEAPGIIVIIGSDTTWTKAGSPYNLTGPILIDQGATLKIEAGATMNLNDYELLVQGTLRAIGSSTEKIHINKGDISFSPYRVVGTSKQTRGVCLNTVFYQR